MECMLPVAAHGTNVVAKYAYKKVVTSSSNHSLHEELYRLQGEFVERKPLPNDTKAEAKDLCSDSTDDLYAEAMTSAGFIP